MKTPLLRLVAAGVLLGPAGLLPHADEAHRLAAATRVLSFTHLWADANGVSHFRDEQLSFEAATPENPTAARPRAPTRILRPWSPCRCVAQRGPPSCTSSAPPSRTGTGPRGACT